MKRLSNKQKQAVEKITGKPWNTWHPEAVRAYFAFTDKGDREAIEEILGKGWENWCSATASDNATKLQEDLFELICVHKHHAVTVQWWKEDFLPGYIHTEEYRKWVSEHKKWASKPQRRLKVLDVEYEFPPLLFLWDFFKPQIDYEEWERQGYPKEKPTFIYPDAFIKHAFEVYKEARGSIPIDEVSGCKEWAKKLGINPLKEDSQSS